MRPPPRALEEPYRSRAVPPGTARYWSWLFAANDSRAPLLGIYALLAEWRALMDPGTESGVAQLKLAWWQEEMQRLAAAAPCIPSAGISPRCRARRSPISRRSAWPSKRPRRHVAGAPLERGADLEAHAERAARRPARWSLRGLPGERAMRRTDGLLHCVAALAAAEYLAGAIADYRREARIGRVVFRGR